MRVSLQRPPTALEQLLGRKRVRALRRRLGFVALGTGVSLLKPRPRLAPWVVTATVTLTTVVVVGVWRA